MAGALYEEKSVLRVPKFCLSTPLISEPTRAATTKTLSCFFVCVESFLNRNVFFIVLGLKISRSRRQPVQYLLRSHCSSPLGLLAMSYPGIKGNSFLVRSLKPLLKATPLNTITLAVHFQCRNLRKCLKTWKHPSDTHAKVRQLKSR